MTEETSAPLVLNPWPDGWSAYLGLRVRVEGRAENAKSGALLTGDGPEIWIDGLQEWPADVPRGTRVQVTGTVIARADLPVFVDEPGSLPRTGIPVPPGTDLDRAARRFLLTDIRWTQDRAVERIVEE